MTERLLDPGAGCPTLAVEGIKLLALPAHQMLLLPLAGCGLRERERKEEEEGGSAADGPDLGHRPSQLPPPQYSYVPCLIFIFLWWVSYTYRLVSRKITNIPIFDLKKLK